MAVLSAMIPGQRVHVPVFTCRLYIVEVVFFSSMLLFHTTVICHLSDPSSVHAIILSMYIQPCMYILQESLCADSYRSSCCGGCRSAGAGTGMNCGIPVCLLSDVGRDTFLYVMYQLYIAHE